MNASITGWWQAIYSVYLVSGDGFDRAGLSRSENYVRSVGLGFQVPPFSSGSLFWLYYFPKGLDMSEQHCRWRTEPKSSMGRAFTIPLTSYCHAFSRATIIYFVCWFDSTWKGYSTVFLKIGLFGPVHLPVRLHGCWPLALFREQIWIPPCLCIQQN